MKNNSIFSVIILFFGIALTNCSNDDGIATPTISQSDVQGVWVVSFFEERGVNETGDFAGFSFDFKSGGTLDVTGNGLSLSGTWSLRNGSDPGEPQELVIAIPTVDKPLEELNDDWDIMAYNSSKIELREISGGDGHLEQLHFTKN